MIDCEGCEQEFDDIDALVEHVAHPDRLCWKAVSFKIADLLTDLRGNRINRSYATYVLTEMMKAVHELGVQEGKEGR